ncbi:MAG: hypothetical protein ACLP5E_29950 [Streptosporangiaceae bacterium]
MAGGRIALANMGPVPVRARAAEQALAGGASVADAAALAAEGTDPAGDIHADRAYRQHLPASSPAGPWSTRRDRHRPA